MGDTAEALFELGKREKILQATQEYWSRREANIIMKWKVNALKEYAIGAAVGGAVTWLATQRLNSVLRNKLSTGIATFCGSWRCDRLLDSSMERILSREQSRMEKEIMNFAMQFVYKHCYPENVFDDSSTDEPKLRWHYRNFYGYTATHSQRRHDSESYSDKTRSQSTDREKTDEPKQVSRNPGVDAITNPFDCVFGLPGSTDKIHHTNTSSTSPHMHGHSHEISLQASDAPS